jgi:hypothetical protein
VVLAIDLAGLVLDLDRRLLLLIRRVDIRKPGKLPAKAIKETYDLE